MVVVIPFKASRVCPKSLVILTSGIFNQRTRQVLSAALFAYREMLTKPEISTISGFRFTIPRRCLIAKFRTFTYTISRPRIPDVGLRNFAN
jgi:hypothetical protein